MVYMTYNIEINPKDTDKITPKIRKFDPRKFIENNNRNSRKNKQTIYLANYSVFVFAITKLDFQFKTRSCYLLFAPVVPVTYTV